MNKWATLAISAVVDFAITAGGAYTAIGGTTFPTQYQLSICAIAGVLSAARGVQSRLSPPP